MEHFSLDSHYLTLFLTTIPLVFAAIFPVLNPIGSAIIVLPLTGGIDQPTRHMLAKKVAGNTLFLLSVVLLAGSPLMAFFGISIPVVQVAGGLVLASMGWKSLSADDPIDNEGPGDRAASKSLVDQTFYPFTFPITVGPGSVAITLTLSAHTTQTQVLGTLVAQSGAVIAFIGLAITVYLSFAYTSALVRRTGPSGTKVIMRLMSFIILCIGAQICWSGIDALLAQRGA